MLAVVGLVVDDVGDRVEVRGGKLGVGPVVVFGNDVGSAVGAVTVGDSVIDP